MTDIVSPQIRSRMMAGIGPKNTKPEITVRKALHHAGYRYSLHKKDLPGKPDLVLRKYNAVIFINGCFWHGHSCHLFRWPSTRPRFWREKIEGNRRRDKKNHDKLKEADWRQLIIWECALKGKSRIPLQETIDYIVKWLHSDNLLSQISGKINR